MSVLWKPPPVAIAIVGPTASGKTALALEVAERLETEIISVDSMQVYRGMVIGTAAPTSEELARVKHHFVGFLDPKDQFSAGTFGSAAREVIRQLNRQNKIALLVGGSGLYLRAVIDGLFPGPARNEAIRARLHAEAERHGVAALYQRLQRVDPDYAAIILPGDLRRIVRALEVYEQAGEPMSRLHDRHRREHPPLDVLQIGLALPRDILYHRIDERVERMLDAGFLDEVRSLLQQGYESRFAELRTLGYREFAEYLRGERTYEDAVEMMKRNTRHYARRQLIWFRGDARIRWLTLSGDEDVGTLADKVFEILAVHVSLQEKLPS